MKNMQKHTRQTEPTTDLSQAIRQRAEAVAQEKLDRFSENGADMSPDETRKTLYELRVHQIELEMQNEELRRVQTELESLRARYFDLYDMAPVGYFTLEKTGRILETNLTAADLLGITRSAMTRQKIFRFILPEDQDIYYSHHKKLLETEEPQKFELRLLRSDGTSFWSLMELVAEKDAEGPPVYRIAVNDISERKATDEIVSKAKAELSEATIAKKQMAYLQAQIKPHFMYNTLSAIIAFCYTDGEKAGDLLTKFSKYLRIVFSPDRQDEMVTLERELELVKVYVEIEKARFGKRLEVVFDVDETLLECLIMPLLLQPLVENAIRHGVLKKINGGIIRINIGRRDSLIEIRIADDGVGMSENRIDEVMARVEDSIGVGIANINQRLYLHTGNKLMIESSEGAGTTISLYLPLNEQTR